MQRRVIVVGLGQAGIRFVRACFVINADSPSLKIVAGVDPDPTKRAHVERLGIPCFSALSDAREVLPVDVAIVTVPERQHYEVLSGIKESFPTLKRIMCEKPLAASIREAHALKQVLENNDVTLNFVERFSPVVEAFQAFVKENRRNVSRVTCFWGKYRVKDPRPTPGVISVELAHPIDLVLALAQVAVGTSFDVVSTVATRSNFDVGEGSSLPLDTVHAAITFASGLQVVASTSLIWSERQRRVELILCDENGIASELAVLVFDDPIWDLDRLQLFDMRSTGGKPKMLQQMEITRSFWPADRLTIGKVCGFIEANLAELEGHVSHLLPRLEQGVYVQEILESISHAADAQALSTSSFRETKAAGANGLSSQIDVLSKMSEGQAITEDELVWDRHY